MTDYDAIIIGSGAGGLSGALRLAHLNFSVLLLEAMSSFGGYLNPFRRRGYTFDTGLHYMGELAKGDTFWSLLSELGLTDAVDFIELDPDGFDRYVFPDFELRLCKGKERFAERLVAAFPKEEQGIRNFFKLFEKIVKGLEAAKSMKSGAIGTIGFILKNPVMMKYSRVPYQRLLDDVTSNKRLQAALSAPWMFYGLPPAKASVMIAIQVWSHILKGGYYPRGGSGSFRDAFINALRDLGTELRNRMRVASIDKQDNEFIVGTESGDQFTARVVLSNADPVITLGELVSHNLLSSRIKNKISKSRPSGGAFHAFIGTDLKLLSLGISDANLVHFNDYDINKIYRALYSPTPPEEFPMFFLTSPSVKDPDGGHAPEGYHTIKIFTGVSYEAFEKWAKLVSRRRGKEYEALRERIGQSLTKTVEHYIPDLSQHLDFVEYATPLSNEFWVNAVRGANYSLEQTPEQTGRGRFMDFTAGIDGLFLAGAGTIAGGIMPCVASGFLSATKASEYLNT